MNKTSSIFYKVSLKAKAEQWETRTILVNKTTCTPHVAKKKSGITSILSASLRKWENRQNMTTNISNWDIGHNSDDIKHFQTYIIMEKVA